MILAGVCFPGTSSTQKSSALTQPTPSDPGCQQGWLLQSLTSGVLSSGERISNKLILQSCPVPFQSSSWMKGRHKKAEIPKIITKAAAVVWKHLNVSGAGGPSFPALSWLCDVPIPSYICHLSWQHQHFKAIFQFCLLPNFSDFLIKIKFKYWPSVVFSVDLYKQNESMSAWLRDRLACISLSASLMHLPSSKGISGSQNI